MAENDERLRFLLNRYANRETSPEEEQEFFEAVNQATDVELEPLLTALLNETAPQQDADRRERILANVLLRPNDATTELQEDNHEAAKVRKLFNWRKLSAAASILFVVALGTYLFMADPKTAIKTDTLVTAPVKDVAAPAGNRAMITLANGENVYLETAANGSLALQEGANIKKLANSKIVYEKTASASGTSYNTLTNPRGSKVIDITLADGSQVWLNAGSSLTFPVAFNGAERNVSVTGEAYFEIAHDPGKPFKVSRGGTAITVLGTHFNVNAYEDENDLKVTLLEGSVSVTQTGLSVLIKPGEQALINQSGIKRTTPDLDQVMAWKNGRFYFDGTDIKTIMRQVEKWYNVEVTYQSDIQASFVAKISREENLSELLKILQLTDLVHFNIEGNKITVMK